jgi:carboxypeptidase PM20D1
MWRWLVGAVAALVVGVGGVMAVRTATFEAAPAAAGGVVLPDAPTVDIDVAAQRLSAAIQIQTISRTPGIVEDPAAFDALHLLLAQSYPRVHASMTRETVAGHSLVYTLQGSDISLAPMVLLAHQDVVPIEPGTEQDWEQSPFSGAIVDGYVWGRGAMDDKGSMIAILEAMEALLAQGFTPQRTVIFAFGHDEEVQGAGAVAIAAQMQARGQRAWFVLDEGMAVVEDFPLTDGPAALIGIAEKGYMSVRVTARADGGHSSLPQDDTALDRLSRAILAIRARPFAGGAADGPAAELLRAVYPALGLLERVAIANQWALGGVLNDQLSATPAGAALARTTIAPTIIAGGTKENVLPQEAHAIINLRLHPRDTPESALEHLRASVAGIEGVTIEPEGRPNPASPVSAIDGEAFRLIAAAAAASSPDEAVVAPMLVLGATDSRHFAAVAENTYRFFPMWSRQEDLSRIHGTGERLSIDNLQRMIAFYAQLIAAGAGPAA